MSSSHSRAGQSAAGAAPGGGTDTRDAEMPATEKDLAEDAPWKKIQQNTFTRWCNEHLKCVGKRLTDLQRDLSDGLRLIALLEVLSQKRMYRKFHPRPNFRQMKLENVSVALEFLEREHIKLVSIGQCGRAVHGHSGEGEVPPRKGWPLGAADTGAGWVPGAEIGQRVAPWPRERALAPALLPSMQAIWAVPSHPSVPSAEYWGSPGESTPYRF